MNSAAAPILGRPRNPLAGDAAAIAFVWVVAASLTLVVAAFTKIGPVVVHLSATHGLHLGDVLTAVVLGTLAVLVTLAVGAQHLIRARGRRHTAIRR